MPDDLAPAQLVVVGSSAGGIEALSTLVSTIPPDLPVPIVIAQHLQPQHPSHLAEILSARSRLPVQTVFDHEALQTGHIYVVPADHHVEINDGHISLLNDHLGRPKPSINLLFSTAAQAYGDGLIAVILTGAGSDGAAGALEVKKTGGTVIIQNPDTASYPAMPRSLSPTTVDFVSNIEEIGPLIYDLTTGGADLARAGESRTLQSLLQLLHERSGLDFTNYKLPTIQRRLQRRLVATGANSLATYRRYLQRHPDEYTRLIGSFLIKVTEFFRDRDLFNTLREQVFPELIASARQHRNELRLWSAGCATGEEAYSLAILVADLLGDELDQFTVRIFATDLDNDAITFARRGIYPASALASLPQDIVTRYFHRLDGDYEVQKRVRSLVIFGQHDLGQRAPFPRTDLILCRNVLIYFTLDLQKRVLQLFAYSLRNGGYLVLGKAETTSPVAEFFTPTQPNLKIYRRQGERLLIPIGQFKDVTPLRPTAARSSIGAIPQLPSREVSQPRTSIEQLGALVFNLPIGVVVVDRRYDIQIINGLAHQLLEIHRSAIGEDLLHLAEQIPSKPLRAIIDAALQGETQPPTASILSVETETGEQRYLHILGYPHQFEGDDGPISSVLLLISDVTEQEKHRRLQERQQQESAAHMATKDASSAVDMDSARLREENTRLTQQIQQLLAVNRELHDANRDLTTSNVELHQSNEEYLVNTEEVQAAAEEVETLNEELQATNEELETLNEELQATVEELNATNDDLEARTFELQAAVSEREAQSRASEAQRAQLEAILVSMGDAVLVVDTSGHSLLVNQAYEQMFGDAQASLPIADTEGNPLPPDMLPRMRAARGEMFTLIFTLPSNDKGPRWFEANAHPIWSDEKLRGGVVVIRDISDRSLRRLQDEFLTLASHELRTPLTSAQAAAQIALRRLEGAPGQESVRRQLEIVVRQVRQMNRLIEDLMDIGRLQTGRLQLQLAVIAFNEIVEQAVESIQTPEPGRQITLSAPAEPLFVQGDPLRLGQIVVNLLNNAIKYAPNSRIEVRLRRVEDEAELQVQDYGPGIAKENLGRLFTRFYQVEQGHGRRNSGLGIGLFITRELTLAHGGTISVDSKLGEGTTFTVRLPLITSEHGDP